MDAKSEPALLPVMFVVSHAAIAALEARVMRIEKARTCADQVRGHP